MPNINPDRELIIEMAKDGKPPREIARELGSDANRISCLLHYERKKGNDIPRHPSGPAVVIGRSIVAETPRHVRRALVEVARVRGISASELAGQVLGFAVRHGLFDDVLDEAEYTA